MEAAYSSALRLAYNAQSFEELSLFILNNILFIAIALVLASSRNCWHILPKLHRSKIFSQL